MQIVILAGGKGERLRPMTEKIPKPMASVNGSPFLEILFMYLKRHGFTNFLLCVGYLSNIIEEFFHDGKDLGISIRYSYEKNPLGNAGAIKNASSLLDDEFIVLNGDTFVNLDYEKFIYFSRKLNKLCTVVGFDNSNEIIDAFNNLHVTDDYNVTKYSKDTRLDNMNYLDCGVYFFRKAVLNRFPQESRISLEYDIFPELINYSQLGCYPITERFYDIGTITRLQIFQEIIKNKGDYVWFAPNM